MSDEQVTASELHDATQEYQEQLAAVAALIAEDPTNTEAQQIHAELQEALAATQAAYTQHFSTSHSDALTNGHTEDATAAAAAAAATAPAAAATQAAHTEQFNSNQTNAPTNGNTEDTTAAAPAAAAAAGLQPQVSRRQGSRTMHPDNIYCTDEPDFAALAVQHPPLAQYVRLTKAGRPCIDFTNWHATKELTAALLKVDFGVTWDLPEGQLVPPVPNRANYIHWINDLLQLSSPPGDPVRGLDIGCGANLIYCLLGAAVYGWHMTGVDVTPVALEAAAAVANANPQLAHLLEVRQSQCSVGHLPKQQQQQQQQQHNTHSASQQQQQQIPGPLLGAMASSTEQFHFCMCNPPFFESIQEANQNPNTACGGTAEEMVCPGGEVAFIRAMIGDSRKLKGRVHWYSSMCGKKASLKVLRQELHSAGVTGLRTTELVQGKTSRWAIAWSFAANPNTANMPLPRRQQQQLQCQQQAIGKNFNSAAASSSSSVQSAQRVSFTVTAGAADGRKLLQSIAALLPAVGGAQQVQVDINAWKIKCVLPAASGKQQQQQDGTSSEPAAKRAKTAANVSSSSVAEQTVEISVFQQRRGTYDVIASVKPASSTSSDLMTAFAAVRDDLALMWPVGEFKCF